MLFSSINFCALIYVPLVLYLLSCKFFIYEKYLLLCYKHIDIYS